jgi:hypothetical protein
MAYSTEIDILDQLDEVILLQLIDDYGKVWSWTTFDDRQGSKQ